MADCDDATPKKEIEEFGVVHAACKVPEPVPGTGRHQAAPVQVVGSYPPASTLRKRGRPKIGERFGLLTVERCAGVDGRRGALWECRCDCGRVALRTTSAMNAARKGGSESACAECNREARSGWHIDRAARMRGHYRELWKSDRTLYGRTAVENICERVAEDLAAEFGEPRESSYDGPLPIEVGEPPGTDYAGHPDALTLDEVGLDFEVSRERVRQIEAKAFRKLAHPSLARTLRPLVFDDEPVSTLRGGWTPVHEAALKRAPAYTAAVRALREAKMDAAMAVMTGTLEEQAKAHRAVREARERLVTALK